MKKLKLTMEFEVPDSKVDLFTLELRKKMHKYLAAHATKVTALDVEITSMKKGSK